VKSWTSNEPLSSNRPTNTPWIDHAHLFVPSSAVNLLLLLLLMLMLQRSNQTASAWCYRAKRSQAAEAASTHVCDTQPINRPTQRVNIRATNATPRYCLRYYSKLLTFCSFCPARLCDRRFRPELRLHRTAVSTAVKPPTVGNVTIRHNVITRFENLYSPQMVESRNNKNNNNLKKTTWKKHKWQF